jgi:hypothetical protein
VRRSRVLPARGLSPKDVRHLDDLGRSSGFRIDLLACAFPRRPILSLCRSGFAAFVPGYSGGTATDLHRFPYSSRPPRAARDTQTSTGGSIANEGEVSIRQVAPCSRWQSRRRGFASSGRAPEAARRKIPVMPNGCVECRALGPHLREAPSGMDRRAQASRC